MTTILHTIGDEPAAPIPSSVHHKRAILIGQGDIDPDSDGWLHSELLTKILDRDVPPEHSGIVMVDLEYGPWACIDDPASLKRPRIVRETALTLHKVKMERPLCKPCTFPGRPTPFWVGPEGAKRPATKADMIALQDGLGPLRREQALDTPHAYLAYKDDDEGIAPNFIDNWLAAIVKSHTIAEIGALCITLTHRFTGDHLFEPIPIERWKSILKLLRALGVRQFVWFNEDNFCLSVARGERAPEKDADLPFIQKNFTKDTDLAALQAPYLAAVAEVWV